MQFPLVGDRLGRESVTGAKKLRSGCDEAKERFDNIVEVVRILACQTKFVRPSASFLSDNMHYGITILISFIVIVSPF